ncbi:DUF3800 domain-containing protein [Amycolatopsis eburnea]|uniref:DUF3800 domain-containing protein n=1 Tax=Amycolatopsis eburnea TaxID=2267691 RepID=A0A3R9FCH0_9PSEU|nr:hypothetical protein [Amycolatopsis eburnea]RSD21894.1 hypothetical protein EIY87_08685 [Amycolatopsis eburnea]
MTVHAFVDESGRAGSYLLCATIVEPAHLSLTRRALQSLLLRGARELHFKKEKEPRRRMLIDRMAALPVTVRLYSGSCAPKTEEAARQRCLALLTQDLLGLQAHRLVLDSRDHRDAHDRQTLQQALGTRPSKTELTYEHVDSTAEPLLWISDAVAWCTGAGGDWRRRANPLVTNRFEV